MKDTLNVNSRTLVYRGTCLKVLIIGTGNKGGNALGSMLLCMTKEASGYFGAMHLASVDKLRDDEFNEYTSGKIARKE